MAKSLICAVFTLSTHYGQSTPWVLNSTLTRPQSRALRVFQSADLGRWKAEALFFQSDENWRAVCSLTLKSKLEDIHRLFTQSNSGDSPSKSKSLCCDEIWNSFSPRDSDTTDPTEQFTARSTPTLSHADQLIWERQSRTFGFKELLALLLTHRSRHQITAA